MSTLNRRRGSCDRRYSQTRSFASSSGGSSPLVERRQNSLGSGVIVNESGLIVTNTHVVKSSGEAEVRVVLADRREFKADIVQQDEKTDIALIKIRGAGAKFPFIRFAD